MGISPDSGTDCCGAVEFNSGDAELLNCRDRQFDRLCLDFDESRELIEVRNDLPKSLASVARCPGDE